MNNRVFFYGTLMAGFDRRRRAGIDTRMRFMGRGWIQGALFDLGLYPAAIPAPEGQVWGEVYEIDDESVLEALDDIEGYRASEPDTSLYNRVQTDATLANGDRHPVWVYFYNAPLGRAERIDSGDYLAYLNVSRG
ncbi:MAG: gamma-glutamylcyclotransferase family protein [Acidobacteriota bacterium]